MKKPIFFRVISLLMVMLLVLSGMAIAEGVQTAEIVFSATDKEDDIIELDITVKNATFMGLEMAVRYNTRAILPIDESGEPATAFKHFATKTEQADFFNTVALTLDAVKGVFGFTLYIMPGEDAEGVNDNGEYVADNKGITLYKFRFKKISEEDLGIEVAFEDDIKAYKEILPEGITIMNYDDGELDATLIYVYGDKDPQQTTVIAPKLEEMTPEEEKEPEFTAKERKKDIICLKIGRNMSFAHGKKKAIDPDNPLVVPYIKNDRTLVPLRFIAETLGAEVLWEEGWDGCIIKKDGTEIKITFGSADFTVNGEKFTYEAPIEVVHDRTMVPVRFVSEALGQDVYWNELNEAVVIAPADNPWISDRAAETTALNEMLVTILGILS